MESFSRLNSLLEREFRNSDKDIEIVDVNQLVKFLDTNITEFNTKK